MTSFNLWLAMFNIEFKEKIHLQILNFVSEHMEM